MTIVELAKQEWTIGEAGALLRVWRIFGTRDIGEVKTQILGVVDATYQGRFLDPTNIKIKEIGRGGWECSVPYTRYFNGVGTPEGDPPTSISFRTSGGSEKITQAPIEYTYVPSGSTDVPDYSGGINFNGQTCEGVEIIKGILDFELEVHVPPSAMTNAYVATLKGLTGRYNNTAFRGFASGEVLYLGVQGNQDKGGTFRLSHGFKTSKNRSSFTVANGAITITSARGWDYLWIDFAKGVNSSKLQTLKPRAAFVHEVYQPGNFALIGVGS